MKKLLGPLVVALLVAGPAFAADMPVKAPLNKAPPPPFTWTGLYIGANAGYGWNSTTGDEFCTTPAPALIVGGPGCSTAETGTLKAKGAFVGGQLGYNYQTGMFVWGIESDIHFSGIHDSAALVTPCCNGFPPTPGMLTTSQSLDWFGTVRGRLGIAAWDRALIYGTGGLIYGEENVAQQLAFPAISYPAAATAMRSGWVAGAGLEYAFTNNFSAKIEGLFYDMGSQTIAFTALGGAGFTESTTFNFKGSMVRLGANLKFGP